MTKSQVLTPDTIVTQSDGQVSCDLGGEAAILNLNKGTYYGLNSVGTRIWTLIKEPCTVAKVLDVILKEYDVPADVCECDLLQLLGRLAQEDLILTRAPITAPLP